MKRYALLYVAAILINLYGCAGLLNNNIRSEEPRLRVINVCILNDKDNPADKNIIRRITTNVFREYEERVGIRFTVTRLVIFDGEADAWTIELGPLVKRACPDTTEIRMIFTNKRIFFESEDGKKLERAGDSQEYFGFLIVYNVAERVLFSDEGGNPALETTLKHEIGHLFGFGHTSDKESFMFVPGNKSYAKWTDEVIRLIRKNKWRVWH